MNVRGASRPGCLLVLLLLAAGIYAAVVVLGSEMDFRAMQNTAEQEARLAETKSDDEIRQVLVARARELELPPQAERVQIRRLPDGHVLITLAYQDTVTFLGRWHWVRARRIALR